MPRYPFARVIAFLLLLVLSSVPAVAQPVAGSGAGRAEPVVPEKVGKELQAYYVGESTPRIDGRLDDEGWQRAQAIDDMVQNDPDNMQPPTERTVVKVLYDDRNVYVGVINYMKDRSKITTAQMVRDAFGALVFLSKHPGIDANRVAVMGMSRGGAVALQAADDRDAKSAGATFAAHVPLYPGCSTQYRNPRMRAPILMLIGADDDYTGVKPCAQYAERIRAQGGKVELKTYEGAHHGFDGELSTRRTIFLSRAQNYRDCLILIEDNGGATLANTGETLDISQPAKAIEILGRVCMKHGATVGFFATARERALEDVKAFLKAHLLK